MPVFEEYLQKTSKPAWGLEWSLVLVLDYTSPLSVQVWDSSLGI